ncbi:hypothetical protein M406DRAFT_330653 [Cryphonectria parasitica EP155]|uniref:Uncharacterized protein n=1 Tax=Cryphonectria parasitica (strain ATCC 38755 / EP155) TaxID=660469 RepID=A0A9P4Y0A4_CRYP1|nr:uncharacterized protein M406DRAFT_330653 [Cryphonectria parasitica EP155]KAF3764308.1 hypothetical protein M406DRAFT_330653 [Cryphonectria parasitica EP155]
MSSSGATIQNGRIVRHQRRRFFSFELYRVSRMIQHPTQMTFRELLYFTGSQILDLMAGQQAQDVCYRMSFAGCGWLLLWKVLYLLGDWLGLVVPWGLICVVVIFFGEQILQRKG